MQHDTSERVLLVARSAWIPYLPGILAGGLMILSPWFFPFPPEPLVGTAAGLALIAWLLVKHRCYAVTITTRRIIVRRGVFIPNRDEIPIDRVDQVSVQRSMVDRFLGSGTLVMAAHGSRRDPITTVRNPDRVQKTLQLASNLAREGI